MTQEFERYQDLIEQLKPVVDEPDFSQILSSVAAQLDKPKRLLLKMELRRLAKPCHRVIDLRGLVDGRCTSYQYEGLTHYLDPIATDVFERQIRAFGRYTVGVYEATNNTENNFRIIHQKQQQQRLENNHTEEQDKPDRPQHYPVRRIQFCNSNPRVEERMNYVVNIELTNQLGETIPATTIDISVHGLKIKLSEQHLFQPAELLNVHFHNLSTEPNVNKHDSIAYHVVEISQADNEQRLTLSRADSLPNPRFDNFIQRFIQGNKRRYKINLDNTIDAIEAKGYEQYYIGRFNTLPIFIEQRHDALNARYVLTNNHNKETLFYWTDEQAQIRIEHLLTPKRLAELKKSEQRQTYIFAFNRITHGKTFFYSATLDELRHNGGLWRIFMAYGCRKASWRVYKLQLTDIHAEQSFVPLTLPDNVSERLKKSQYRPSARVMSRLVKLNSIALLSDITEQYAARTYQYLPFNKTQLPCIKPFVHPRQAASQPVSLHRFKNQNQRSQERFQLRTEVELRQSDDLWMGTTEDISINGVKVELLQPYNGKVFDEMTLSFPLLQKTSHQHNLHDLIYEVRNIGADGHVLHLQALDDGKERVAQVFFSQLIKNNRNKMKAYRDEESIPGLGEALRNIYSANLINVAFFFSKQSINLLPDSVAINDDHPLAKLIINATDPDQGDLRLLYSSPKPDALPNLLKRLKNNSPAVGKELLLAYNPQATDEQPRFTGQFIEQFDNAQACRAFIRQALGTEFFAVRVELARTGRPDTDILRTEMKYLGSYAVHRAKMLEEQLWNIQGVGSLLDITEEVLLRYGFIDNVGLSGPHTADSALQNA